MAIKPNKGSPLLGEPARLRPLPLSQHIVSGAMYVLREDGVPMKINDLGTTFDCSHKHRLLGPEGVVEVSIQIGGFRTGAQATTLQANDGREVCFVTSLNAVRLNAESAYRLEPNSAVFRGFSVVRRQRVDVEVRVSQVQLNKSLEHYAYTLTPGPIYLGAGRKPIFLPFEVQ